jgi:hypothetical protein
VLAAAWAAGIFLCVVAAAIVLYMGYRGIQYLSLSLILSRTAKRSAKAASCTRSSGRSC